MKVLKNYIYNTGYQILAIILPLITSPYVSRRLLPLGVGIYSYTYSITQYFVLVAGLGVSFYGAREVAYVRDSKEKLSLLFWKIIKIEIITVIITFLIFIVFCLFYKKYFIYFIFQSIYIVDVLFNISWLFAGLEDFKKIVIRNSIVKILTVILIFIFIKGQNDTGVYILILSLGTLIGDLTYWPYLKDLINFVKIKDLTSKTLLPSILALFIPQIAVQVYTQINKTLLGVVDSTTAAGYYNYSDSMVRMSLTLITSVSAVMLPHISNAISNNKKEQVRKLIINSFDVVTCLSIGISLGLSSISIKFAPFFYGSEYTEVGEAMFLESIIVIPIAWATIIGNQYLVATKKMKPYTNSVIFGAIFNLAVGYYFIKYLGLTGAMLVTILSEFVVAFYQIFSVRDDFRLNKLFMNFWKYLISGVIMFIVVFFMNLELKMNFVNLILEVMVGVVVYFFIVYIQHTSMNNFLVLIIHKAFNR